MDKFWYNNYSHWYSISVLQGQRRRYCFTDWLKPRTQIFLLIPHWFYKLHGYISHFNLMIHNLKGNYEPCRPSSPVICKNCRLVVTFCVITNISYVWKISERSKSWRRHWEIASGFLIITWSKYELCTFENRVWCKTDIFSALDLIESQLLYELSYTKVLSWNPCASQSQTCTFSTALYYHFTSCCHPVQNPFFLCTVKPTWWV